MLLTLTLVATAAIVQPVPLPVAPSHPFGRGDSIEAVKLESSDGVALSALYYAPTIKGNVKAPGAVLLHAAGEDKRQLDEVAKYLQRKGFGVLALDLRGHGESVSAACDWKSLDDAGKEASWKASTEDVQAAANFLRARGEIHSNNLSLVGVGSGAGLAVKHALDDDTVRALVLIAPVADNFGFNLVGGLGELAGLPTLIVSSKDQREEASRFVNAAERQGDSAIELSVVKAAPEGVLGDSATRAALSSWLLDHVAPKR